MQPLPSSTQASLFSQLTALSVVESSSEHVPQNTTASSENRKSRARRLSADAVCSRTKRIVNHVRFVSDVRFSDGTVAPLKTGFEKGKVYEERKRIYLSEIFCTYTGDVKNGIPCGFGRLVYIGENGTKEIQFVGGFEGASWKSITYGKMFFSPKVFEETALRCESQFILGAPTGKSKLDLTHGDKYSGEVNRKYQPHGKGKLTLLDGTLLEGFFYESKLNGLEF